MGAARLELAETEVEGFTVSQLSNIYKKIQYLTTTMPYIYEHLRYRIKLSFLSIFCGKVHHYCTITNTV